MDLELLEDYKYIRNGLRTLRRLVINSMPCQLKTLLHQHWSQMKAVVQLFKGK